MATKKPMKKVPGVKKSTTPVPAPSKKPGKAGGKKSGGY